MNTQDTDKLKLTINTSISLIGNSYREWEVERIIQEAVQYVVHKKVMPKDLKRVLCYYGIVDHFYPESVSDGVPLAEGETGPEDYLRSPESVERARAYRHRPSLGKSETED